MFTDGQSAVDPVLMETIAPVGTAEIGAIDTVYFQAALLGHRPLGSINRMVVVELSDDLGSINNLGTIQGYAKINR